MVVAVVGATCCCKAQIPGMHTLPKNRLLLLSGMALLFHAVGFWGIAIHPITAVQQATPLHLLLMFVLLGISFADSAGRFWAWAVSVALLCFLAEWIGVTYGVLFGHYRYGTVLGPALAGVPLLIGVNWVIVCAGAACVAGRITSQRPLQALLGAGFATLYDWLLEPVAVRQGYWQWHGGAIPLYNYVCWFGLSLLVMLLWQKARLKPNFFGIILFLVQLVFFGLLRWG